MNSSTPKSLNKLLGNISAEQQHHVLDAQQKILGFDDRIIEVGRTTSTQYDLRKGDKTAYKTLLCAQFITFTRSVHRPQLLL